jgi:hypothetical protein
MAEWPLPDEVKTMTILVDSEGGCTNPGRLQLPTH